MPTFDSTKDGYKNLWNKAKVIPERRAAVTKMTDRYFANLERYEAVEKATGVPSWWVFCVHMRESGGNFAGVLHNGEHIIGTGQKTRLVPAGRGPFNSWQEAAIDALRLKGLDRNKDWSAPRACYEFERFNGFGYFGKRVNSPYVWADTTNEGLGKYVSDGKFNPNVADTQVGCAALLKILCEKSAAINAEVNPDVPMSVAVKEKEMADTAPVLVDTKPWYLKKTVLLSIMTVVSTLVALVTKNAVVIDPATQNWIVDIAVAIAGASGAGAVGTAVTSTTVTPLAAEKIRNG